MLQFPLLARLAQSRRWTAHYGFLRDWGWRKQFFLHFLRFGHSMFCVCNKVMYFHPDEGSIGSICWERDLMSICSIQPSFSLVATGITKPLTTFIFLGGRFADEIGVKQMPVNSKASSQHSLSLYTTPTAESEIR